ncbi:leucine-rich repeat receptor-like protein kinase PXC1 [Andrographis paniculata]|uniref:leucine-rich repeat receptor-like protein kinase PXC1 n=1 Tax=Andrographis paniculata TaxID=175694 RepID=UPI0021E9A22A|nr:leucine-rich repeat receptor-like protein kinase PXC1 [Andrographis paniculata]
MDFTTLSFLLLTISASSAAAVSAANDTAALSLFLSQTDLHGTLTSNWTTTGEATTACAANWIGVNCTDRRVTAVALPSLNLRGPIDALSSLQQLRLLDLRGNRLNGTLNSLANCLNLKLVYLSGNDFSGEIPPELSSLHRLLRLDLSNNNLHGSIPSEFSKLSRLLTLKLQSNALSGTLPNFLDSLPQLKDLNLSNNEFSGILPKSLSSRYGASSFSGNPNLCGGGNPNFANCSSAGKLPPAQTVPSNPTSLPSPSIEHHHRHSLSDGAVVAIVAANSVLLLLLASIAVCYYCCSTSKDTNSMAADSEGGKRSRSSYSSEKRVYANNGDSSDGTNSTNKSKLVFFDRKKKQFELEELLRASAELLGKGNLGSVYKAVLDDGSTVAVKRLKDANPCGRKEFEQYMEVIGRMRHPNVVKLRGYYYAREEKLLVYDHLPNGSLHSLLHERRGPGRVPLDWTTRVSLILGAARGLARIHQGNNNADHIGSRIPHGNIKSSNVLLDKNGIACISDFGLSLLLSPAHTTSRLGGYRAPEQVETKLLSHKADVYSFGVVLLEILTGRDPSLDLPNWVRSVVRDEWTAEVFDSELLRYKNIEEELVSMLHVAMACVVAQPEKRPGMEEVVMMVEEIRVEQSPLGEDYIDSRNSLSPSLANTDDGLVA